MKNIFNNKLFIIFSLFIILTFSMFSSCFADNNIPTHYEIYDEHLSTNVNFDVPDSYFNTYSNYFFTYLQEGPYSYYLFCFSNSNLGYIEYSPNSYYLTCENISSTNPVAWYRIDFDSRVSSSSSYYQQTLSSTIINNSTSIDGISFNFLSANSNVYNFTTNEVVFQGAPQGGAYKIPTLTQVEEIPQVMEGVLQILIPIGLILLSIGLVILVTRYLIYRLK